MTKSAPLLEIGSEVRVDLLKVRDRFKSSLTVLLGNNPCGKVLDYKMTDGGGIGYVLELQDGLVGWFFEEEIMSYFGGEFDSTAVGKQKLEENSGREITQSIVLGTLRDEHSGRLLLEKKSLIELINPINFFKWLVYALKDVL